MPPLPKPAGPRAPLQQHGGELAAMKERKKKKKKKRPAAPGSEVPLSAADGGIAPGVANGTPEEEGEKGGGLWT